MLPAYIMEQTDWELGQMHPLAHFKTITKHRHLVCKYCFRLGLYRQGLLHDLSKYSPTEFRKGAQYYQGTRSPNDAERKETGVSLAWLHHKGRNRHHLEYWIDYCFEPDGSVHMGGYRMPIRYVAEMFCDRIAACRVYMKEDYTDAAAYDYFMRSKKHLLIHPDTRQELEEMLRKLKTEGEERAFSYVRKRIREDREKERQRRKASGPAKQQEPLRKQGEKRKESTE